MFLLGEKKKVVVFWHEVKRLEDFV